VPEHGVKQQSHQGEPLQSSAGTAAHTTPPLLMLVAPASRDPARYRLSPTSSICFSRSAGSWYTRLALARTSSSSPYPSREPAHPQCPRLAGEHVPDAVAHHAGALNRVAKGIGRGKEQVRVRFGVF
jgi:hypothetical protein